MSRTSKQFIPLYLILGGFLVLTPAVSEFHCRDSIFRSFPVFKKGAPNGTIASIQGGGDTTHPTWILSGQRATNLINKTKQDFNQTNPARF